METRMKKVMIQNITVSLKYYSKPKALNVGIHCRKMEKKLILYNS